MAHCCVPKCTSNSKRDKALNFHRMPLDKEIRKLWIIAIRRDVGPLFQVKDRTYVCSLHFKASDYKHSFTGLRQCLVPKVVPSVFAWTKDKPAPRRAPKERKRISPVKRPEKAIAPSFDHTTTTGEYVNMGEEMDLEENVMQGTDCVEGNCSHDMDKHVDCLLMFIKKLTEEIHLNDKQINKLEEELIARNEQDSKNKESLECANQQVESMQQEIKTAKQQLEEYGATQFLVVNIENNDKLVRFYTGFQTSDLFKHFMNYVVPTAANLKYIGKKNGSKLQTKISLRDELFMFLVHVHSGLLVQDLAVRFNLPMSIVSKIINTWANHLYFILGGIPIWPSRKMVDQAMPSFFKEAYPSTRVILDCIEIKIQQPSSLVTQSQMYSHFKGATTLKCLVGISPSGGICFVSNLYSGRISDKEITKQSGILDLLEAGDSVMADKGFLILDLLQPIGVSLNTPPFLGPSTRFQEQEVEETQAIARVRIHVERAIKRIKEFHIFDGTIPLTMAGSINEIWTVCCLLRNYQGSLLKKSGR